MKWILTGIAAPAAAILFALAFAGSTPASAGEYCRIDVSSRMMGCGYDTLEQCQAMSSGRGGDCLRDPFLKSPANAYAYQPKHAPAKKPAGN